MQIKGIGTAVPANPILQEDTLEFVLSRFSVQERTRELYKRTFSNKSIEKRYFALDDLEHVLETDHDRKNNRFEREAAALSRQSLTKALAHAHLAPTSLDFLVATTCTGYLCPGLSSYLVEECGLRADIRFVDLVGMGCGAAIPAIEQAFNFLKANPGKTAAVVCTEICSAAMFSNDDIDIVISNTIFGDGSAALVMSRHPGESRPSRDVPANDHSGTVRDPGLQHREKDWAPAFAGATPVFRAFESLIVPEWRSTLRFETENGHLKNVLGKNVPNQAGEMMKKISGTLLSKTGIPKEKIAHWIMHAGGEKVLRAIERDLELDPSALISARTILKNNGNMSSPTVLFVLEELLRRTPGQRGDFALMGAFGAGFSAYGALLEWI